MVLTFFHLAKLIVIMTIMQIQTRQQQQQQQQILPVHPHPPLGNRKEINHLSRECNWLLMPFVRGQMEEAHRGICGGFVESCIHGDVHTVLYILF